VLGPIALRPPVCQLGLQRRHPQRLPRRPLEAPLRVSQLPPQVIHLRGVGAIRLALPVLARRSHTAGRRCLLLR